MEADGINAEFASDKSTKLTYNIVCWKLAYSFPNHELQMTK